ncbi:MAG TPA: hypothetical protein VNL96_04890, partial [Gemmatimonadaceae bacterium]|nr:hypothetical protein [Gemmatimonadaceae bacterium]
MNQFGHEFRWRVVRARGLALRAIHQLKPPPIRHSPFAIRLDHRVVLEQAFINRTEFLHIQRGVVDAPGRLRRDLAVVGQVPEGLEQVPVGDGTGVKVDRLEEFAVERRRAEKAGEPLVG